MPRLLLPLLVFAAACQPQAHEVQGIYLGEDSQGIFFPCDNGGSVMRVHSAALQARYRALTDTGGTGAFVRLRAETRDSGSVYDSRHYLVLDSIMEMRARRSGECPGVVEGSEVLVGS
ncbi:MAG TPA: hypothetical protein VFK36_12255 [Gemmatimonadales bacterium]|nr:hypothetical protein [Gemmatimonadales bacterium]